MLTSYPNLDSTFCSPIARTSSSSTTTGESQELCFQLPSEQPPELWLGGLKHCPEDILWWTGDCHQRDSVKHRSTVSSKKTEVMEPRFNPDDDLTVICNNVELLNLCGYYYGNLSWIDASHLLKQTKVGTFLVRDSEHHSYLYALSVQTRRGPTSCRIEYLNGRFKLDSSEDLVDKMPRFASVTDLIDHYVNLTKNLPRKNSGKELSPVWLDMDEENSMDVPVQIYKPLYKNVQSLQHMCRLTIQRLQKEKHQSIPFIRTTQNKLLYTGEKFPPKLLDYLNEYPHPQ